jgi:FHS family L-fucose permease-like MFS transporter
MNNNKKKNYTVPFIVITGLFFMWGFMTCMNDILIPYLKNIFELSHFESMLVQFAFFGAYFVGSIIYFVISAKSGDPINRIGYKNGILLGLLLSAIGSAMFYPAASLVSYGFFLSALFIMGLGFTLLQIAANPYVAVLGKEDTASSRLNLSQGFNSLGTTLAPLLGGYLVFKYFANASGADSVKIPYLFFTGVFLLLAILIKISNLPSFYKQSGKEIEKGAGALKYPHLVLGMIAIFMYVGSEVSIGSIMISFLGLEEIAGLSEASASVFVSFYWGGLMIGRFMGAISLSKLNLSKKRMLMKIIPMVSFVVIWYFQGINIAVIYSIFLVLNFIAFMFGKSLPGRTLMIFALLVVGLLITAILNTGEIAMWAIIGIGIFNSIMWSNIFTLSIKGLGKHTGQGSSLLVMMVVGGAIIPVIQGATADAIGVHYSFVVPIIAYLYIAFFGFKGWNMQNAKDKM